MDNTYVGYICAWLVGREGSMARHGDMTTYIWVLFENLPIGQNSYTCYASSTMIPLGPLFRAICEDIAKDGILTHGNTPPFDPHATDKE